MEVLQKNIAAQIKKSKKMGVAGMSFKNLQQVTSTQGLTISVEEYKANFNKIASEVAKKFKFNLYV